MKAIRRLAWYLVNLWHLLIPYGNPNLYRVAKRYIGNKITFIDVGANLGSSTDQVLSLYEYACCIIIEPTPNQASLLKKEYIECTVLPFAVGKENKPNVSFFVNEENSEINSLSRASSSSKEIKVDQVRLDSVIKKMTLKPDLIKIDTEGHDLEVLEGLGEEINNVPAIICEMSVTYYNTYVDLISFLSKTHVLVEVLCYRSEGKLDCIDGLWIKKDKVKQDNSSLY